MTDKKYTVRVSWEVTATLVCTAEDLDAACELIEEMPTLPECPEYVEGSFVIHRESSREGELDED